MSVKMINREKGFTLIELLITMAVFIIGLVLVSNFFVGQLTLFKQQSRIAETNIEGILGLDIMRRDIENGGTGLPWSLSGAVYCEALEDANTAQHEVDYNDCDNSDCTVNASHPPRAFVSGAAEGLNGSDVLVVKGTSVGTSAAAQKWTHVFPENAVTEWTPATERMETNDRVIVVSPGTSGSTRNLVVSGGSFTTRYNAATDPDSLVDGSFAPSTSSSVSMAYGVTGEAGTAAAALRMPFNRADFYVRRPADMPSRCSPNTGILYKATVNQGNTGPTTGGGHTEMPLLDCVADMRVLYVLDTDNNGTSDTETDDITFSGVAADEKAETIRGRLKEVRVYILSHEGQRDRSFTYPSSTVNLGEPLTLEGTTYTLGRAVNLATLVGAGWQNYRWKIYTIVVKPTNLGKQLGT